MERTRLTSDKATLMASVTLHLSGRDLKGTAIFDVPVSFSRNGEDEELIVEIHKDNVEWSDETRISGSVR